MFDKLTEDGGDTTYTFFDSKASRKERPDTALPLRIIAVPLASGDTEVLVTNLMNSDEHTREALSKLYTTRWDIETAFFDMKIKECIEKFSATHKAGIIQEIYSFMIFALLQSEVEASVRITARQKTRDFTGDKLPLPTHTFNRLMITDTIRRLLHDGFADEKAMRNYIRKSIQEIVRNKVKRRPGREEPRVAKRKR